jgi:hypothetical protein
MFVMFFCCSSYCNCPLYILHASRLPLFCEKRRAARPEPFQLTLRLPSSSVSERPVKIAGDSRCGRRLRRRRRRCASAGLTGGAPRRHSPHPVRTRSSVIFRNTSAPPQPGITCWRVAASANAVEPHLPIVQLTLNGLDALLHNLSCSACSPLLLPCGSLFIPLAFMFVLPRLSVLEPRLPFSRFRRECSCSAAPGGTGLPKPKSHALAPTLPRMRQFLPQRCLAPRAARSAARSSAPRARTFMPQRRLRSRARLNQQGFSLAHPRVACLAERHALVFTRRRKLYGLTHNSSCAARVRAAATASASAGIPLRMRASSAARRTAPSAVQSPVVDQALHRGTVDGS